MNEINENDENEIANDFYAKKMKNITEGGKNITEGGIYNLVKNLCEQFCRGKEYKINIWNKEDFNENKQQKHASFQKEYESRYGQLENNPDLFVPPNFSGPKKLENDSISGFGFGGFNNDEDFEPFIFFEKVDPNNFSESVKNNPEAIANYVKQFAHYLSELFKDGDFVYFLISSEENIETLGKIIASDFVLKGDARNPELFKESHLLDVGTSLVGKYNSCKCHDNEIEKTHRHTQTRKNFNH